MKAAGQMQKTFTNAAWRIQGQKIRGHFARDMVSGSPLVFPLQKREGWVLYKPLGMKIVENKGEIPRGMFLAKNDQFKRKNTKKVCVLSLLLFHFFCFR